MTREQLDLLESEDREEPLRRKLVKILKLSKRTTDLKRETLCDEIGFKNVPQSERLDAEDFAHRLVTILFERQLINPLCKLCEILETDFPGGPYFNDLKEIKVQIVDLNDKLKNSPYRKDQYYRLLHPCNFDLTELIAESRNKLLGKSGLMGIVLPCEEPAFVKNFCLRLKDEFNNRKDIEVRDHLGISYKNPVKIAVQRIQQCRLVLQNKDIIYPIQIQDSVQASNIADDLWNQLYPSFRGDFKHRLMLIIWGSENITFSSATIQRNPPNLIQLKPPIFTDFHISDWVFNVSKSLNWSEEIPIKWKDLIINTCCIDNPESRHLHTGLVYEHLTNIINFLEPNITPNDFLKALYGEEFGVCLSAM